jgi:NAD-dependent dihydropyrimidine dehydrogenase PreA subunit
MGIFIQVEVDAARISPELTQALIKLCPVDIFETENGQLTMHPEQEDECTLCQLCLDAAPPGAITIRKKYRDEVLVSHGAISGK